MLRSGHLLNHWSNTQATVALSSGEVELRGIVRGASEGLGIQSLAADLGLEVKLEVFTDSTAAEGMVARKGLGALPTPGREPPMSS